MSLRDDILPDIEATLMELGAAATLTRVVRSGGSRYKAGGKAATTQTINTYAILGTETITDDQGRVITRSVATMLAQPVEADKLTLAGQTYLVGDVTSIAPQGEAIVWKAVVSA